ncbi:hypothetical protein [Spirillospora sp. CA-294931]|uniref:hypothetical protein n=1 Tax=Spirillospora sp. CA-294931 TaxID=3240042 RepID=UPI003D932873
MRLQAAHQAALAQGKDDVLRAFRTDTNVTALAYGFRRRGGALTDEPVVIASVAKKRPAGYVARDRLLPRTVTVDGRRWGVDVIEAGRFSLSGARADDPDPKAAKYRPLIQGAMIGNLRTGDIGTLGCVVRDMSAGGAAALLTAGHALGSLNGARAGDTIVQPVVPLDAQNAVGTLSRFTTLVRDRPNTVDAAVVRVADGISVERWVIEHAIAPVAFTHPLAGIHIANGTDGSGLFARIGDVFSAMNLRSWNDLGDPEFPVTCDVLDFDMNVEKVGLSGYTSRPITAMGVTPVNLKGGAPGHYYMFKDLVQVGAGFSAAGDSGSAVLLGGDGRTSLPVEPGGSCGVMEGVGTLFDLPLKDDITLADTFRDDFLLHSRVGRLLVRMFYVNFDLVLRRIDEQAPADATEKDYADTFYAKYHDFLKQILTSPDSPTRVVTQEHLQDVGMIKMGLEGRMTAAENTLAGTLYGMFERTLGMNRSQIVTLMNNDAFYREVHDALARVPEFQHLGPVGADD